MTPEEVRRDVASRVRALRLRREWTQATLAEKSGVAAPTIKNFERTGQITLSRLLLIARALDALPAFALLFAPPAASSLTEIEQAASGPKRVRGRRRRRP